MKLSVAHPHLDLVIIPLIQPYSLAPHFPEIQHECDFEKGSGCWRSSVRDSTYHCHSHDGNLKTITSCDGSLVVGGWLRDDCSSFLDERV